LRTTKEDLVAIKQRHVAQGNAALNNGVPKTEDQTVPGNVATPSTSGQQEAQQSTTPHTVKQDWEYVDEIVAILKTASPLLALTLETMVDQCSTKFKATPEEEIYRFTFMLLQDGLSVSWRVHVDWILANLAKTYCSRILNINDDGSLTEVISRNIGRLLHHLGGPARVSTFMTILRARFNEILLSRSSKTMRMISFAPSRI
jgi:transformation/transcription domain-associated protein